MGKYISMTGTGYADLAETSEYGRQWERRAKKNRLCLPKRPRGRPRKVRADFGAPMVMSDIKAFVSPIDGEVISSRSKLKAHEQRHGVKQNGDMKKGEIIAKETKRNQQSLEQAKGSTARWE